MESSKQTDTGTHFKWFTQNFSFELHAGKSARFLFWNIFEFSGQTNNSQFVLMAFMPLILYNSALIKFLCLFLVINTNGGYRIHALLDLEVIRVPNLLGSSFFHLHFIGKCWICLTWCLSTVRIDFAYCGNAFLYWT